MAGPRLFANFARWHIWLGWLVAVPLLLWTISGLVMVVRPIEEVRGEHLRVERSAQPVTTTAQTLDGPVTAEFDSARIINQRGRNVMIVKELDGSFRRMNLDTSEVIAPVDAAEARAIVASEIVGGDAVASLTQFDAGEVPFDFRRPQAVWQVALEDGTHVYIGRGTGEIEAVRTRWWRLFDLMWGFHIMDLEEREDTSHPILIGSAALALTSILLGTVLMFRRRKARVKAQGKAE